MNPKFSRRQFIGAAGNAALILLAGRSKATGRVRSGEFAFLEAEGFEERGGWELDQQSMDQMGSPYLLAHGLGVPVADAKTVLRFPSAGTYRVWVRTRDWVAPWKAPGAPGKFQVMIDGEPLAEVFGTKNENWHWHDGGTVTVGKQANVALHDLTGFEGRCDAILFCKDHEFEPVNDLESLTKFRRKLLGLPAKPDEGGSFDFVVVGGGIAGTCAALSAARNGLNVALIQDRPVLGGNGSSEVRVWPGGHVQQQPYPHVGDIVMELLPPGVVKKKGQTLNGTVASNFDDARKLEIVRAEPRIKLLINHRVMEVESADGVVKAVIAQSTETSRQTRIAGRFFADCTGDAKVGFLAGADYEYEVGNNMGSSNLWRPMDASDEQEVLKCECKDKDALTTRFRSGKTEQPFPRCPWAIDLSDKPFPGRGDFTQREGKPSGLTQLGGWFWESGFDKDQINDIERIRDLNMRAMYGAWDALKNVDGLYPNHRLGWSAFIAGKRESRRLMGDVVLDAKDFMTQKKFPDGAFPCSWHIDLHMPHDKFKDGHQGDEFISDYTRGEKYRYKGPYWAPYRCLYSRNVSNLFMAGRDISVTKEGLGAVRVMKTCGGMGEVVGKAASLCIKHNSTPRGIYQDHLAALFDLLRKPGSHRV